MQSDEYILHIFLSTPADHKRPFYKRDVLNICCLSSAERISLAFRNKWIAGSVLEHVQQERLSMVGWKVLLIFCEDLGTSEGDVYRFHPIRHAQLIRVVGAHDGVTFDLLLGEFVTLNMSAPEMHTRLATIVSEHPNYRKLANGAPDQRAKFVCCAPDNFVGERTGVDNAWDAMVNRLRSARGLSDALFFVVANEHLGQYPTVPSKAVLPRSEMRTDLRLSRGEEIPLTLYGIAGADASFEPPVITVSDSVIRVSGPFIRQHLHGYAIRYQLRVHAGWDADGSMFSVSLPRRTGANISFGGPELSFHIDVVPRLVMITWVVGLLAIGSAFSSLDRDTLQVMGLSPDLSLVFKALGPLLLGIGAFLGFKTLPGH